VETREARKRTEHILARQVPTIVASMRHFGAKAALGGPNDLFWDQFQSFVTLCTRRLQSTNLMRSWSQWST
jgi:hypothetical protein